MKSKQELKDKKKRIAEKLKVRNLKKKTKRQFSRSKLIKEADRVFSLYIRGRDSWKPCCTCWTAWTENAQCGHCFSRRHYHTRWIAMNANWQCYRCNMLLSGEQYKHSQFIDEKYWKWTTAWLEAMTIWTDKISDSEILETIQHYYKQCFEMWLDYKPKKQFLNTPQWTSTPN